MSDDAPLGLIGNGRAGTVSRYRRPVERAVARRGWLSRFPRSFSELEDNLHEFAERGVNRLAMLGGDGTNHQTISRAEPVFERPVDYIFLGKGTQDKERRIHGAGDQCPVEQLDAIAENNVRVLHKRLLEVEADGVTRLGFLFGAGLPHKFMERYYEEGARRFTTIMKVMWSALCRTEYTASLTRPVTVQLDVNGEQRNPQDYSAILIGSTRNVDTLHAPLYRADRKDKAVHLIATSATPAQMLKEYFAILRGRPLRCAEEDTAIEEVVMRGNGTGLRYMIDGDLASEVPYEAKEIRVRPGPIRSLVLPRT